MKQFVKMKKSTAPAIGRHANLRTTVELYTQAPMGAKREAQRKIAEQIAQARG
jgi:hypothetical protein